MKVSGMEAVKKIKAADPSAKIIIVSIIEGKQAEIVEAIRLGVSGYIGKPINREALLREVTRVLGS